MQIDELPALMQDALTVKRVFGEPYQVDGVTIIPVARVGGGGGAGGGSDPGGGEGKGLGFGLGATPSGAYVVKNGDVTWVPALDTNTIVTRGAVVAVTALWTWRSVAKARHRRKAKAARHRA